MATPANYTPLSPQSFLLRNARVYPEKIAIVDGDSRLTYAQFLEQACRLANGLLGQGLTTEANVALLAPNTSAHLVANFGVHMAGGSLVAINTRLSPQEIAYIVDHSQARIMIVDAAMLSSLQPVIGELGRIKLWIVAGADSVGTDSAAAEWRPEGAVDYEAFVRASSQAYPGIFPEDENQTIALNYTSGTTGKPKGVIYTHRSVYLNGICDVLEMHMDANSVHLWTLPMFHCSGWCYTWGVTALGATHICLRMVTPNTIIRAILDLGVTHLCGAPIVLQMLADGAQKAGVEQFSQRLKVSVAAAPPSPRIIQRMHDLNVDVVHVYGLTETYGPTTACEIQPEWSEKSGEQRARLIARQGVPYMLAEDVQVMDRNVEPVPADGQTLGEICMRGNIVMKGYYREPQSTAAAFRGGWFHSGDLGVMHPDGYIELRDRAKDIIISGGENISTIEVENVLYTHPAVKDVAVVSQPDDKWGEVAVAFVTPAEGSVVSEAELIAYCRQHLAHFKAPKAVFFEELPRTSTGKVQKYVLREKLWKGREKRIN